jgi:phosphotransferase system enzyme I (PtsP)
MPSPFIPRIKAFLRDISTDVAQRAAVEVLAMSDSASIRSHLVGVLKEIVQVQ